MEAALAFKGAFPIDSVEEVSPNFLASSRMKLQEALEGAEQARGWTHLVFDLGGWMRQIKLAPALSMALLIFGFAAGSLTSYRIAAAARPHEPVAAAPAEANIAGIESIDLNADSNRVVIKYDTLRAQTAEGATSDPQIQRLLLMAAHDPGNSRMRQETIGMLSPQAEDNAVREALISAVRYDKDSGVRLKALDGLKGYVRNDVQVRDAVLEALMHDANTEVRSEAIRLLDPVRADTSVREAFQVLAEHDRDKAIRSEVKRVLTNMPALD